MKNVVMVTYEPGSDPLLFATDEDGIWTYLFFAFPGETRTWTSQCAQGRESAHLLYDRDEILTWPTVREYDDVVMTSDGPRPAPTVSPDGVETGGEITVSGHGGICGQDDNWRHIGVSAQVQPEPLLDWQVDTRYPLDTSGSWGPVQITLPKLDYEHSIHVQVRCIAADGNGDDIYGWFAGSTSVTPIVPSDPPDDALSTVILGDSFSSGQGAHDYDLNGRCSRSTLAWGGVLDQISPSIDVAANLACSGARVSHVASEPFQGQDAQLDDLQELVDDGVDVDLVMFTIGGNDAGFSRVMRQCRVLDCSNGPLRNAGRRADRAKQRIQSELLPRLETIVPDATVVLVGYPRLFPADHGDTVNCGWLEDNERILLNGAVGSLTLRGYQLSDETDVEFINSYNAIDGHELCTADSYFNPITSTYHWNSEQAHPTSLGYYQWAGHIRQEMIDQGLIDS